jgi:hypothetical protein
MFQHFLRLPQGGKYFVGAELGYLCIDLNHRVPHSCFTHRGSPAVGLSSQRKQPYLDCGGGRLTAGLRRWPPPAQEIV